MKVSLNTAQNYSNVPLLVDGVDDLVFRVGAQLGAVEEVVEYAPRYKSIVVARVISCEKHPNADKLSVCTIDDGGVTPNIERTEEGYVQVVCGAPNVREGLTVAWVPPGATVPVTYDKDPFVLEARELRGEVSNGMLASASELGISNDHDGLLEIKVEDVGEDLIRPGTEFSKLYGLDDVIIDIENKMFTHRPDCFGILGVAREIAGIQGLAFSSPDWYKNNPNFSEVNGLELRVDNQVTELAPRFMAVCMDNIAIKPSPIWLQALLNRIGVKPINNIVDITNYLSYVTAQPLHAYDYDKVAALSNGNPSLVIRFPKEGEKIALLNGKTIQPRSEAIMIATDKELIGIGGVMGGTSTEVDDQTKRIIIECANFDMYSIRKTSMAHGLFTDAVTRFNKGQSPLQNDRVVAKTMEMIQQYADGSQASSVIESPDYEAHEGAVVHLLPEFINERLGVKLDAHDIKNILINVEFEVSADEDLGIRNPFWRTDIAIPEDIVEEVGRLYGFEKLPLELPERSVTPVQSDKMLALKSRLRHLFSSFGANELLTYSFVDGNLLSKAGQSPDVAFKLSNALSPELQYYRLSLTPSLLSHVHANIKAGFSEFALFELNKTHIKLHAEDDNGVPKEFNMLALTLASKSSKSAGYYQARAYLDAFADDFGLNLHYEPLKEPSEYQVMQPFEYTRAALVTVAGTDIFLGVIGEYKATIVKNFKLPQHSAGFELDLDGVLQALEKSGSSYVPLSRFPSVVQDVCFEISKDKPYGTLNSEFENAIYAAATDDLVADYKLIDMFANKETPDVKRITFRVSVYSYERTLNDSIVSKIIDTVVKKLEGNLGARRI